MDPMEAIRDDPEALLHYTKFKEQSGTGPTS